MRSFGLGEDGSSEHEDLLFGSNDTSFNHDEVISDNTIVGESSHRGDHFIGQILVGGSVIVASSSGSFSDSIDFFILFSSMVITQLTGSRDSPSNSGRVPGSDTSDFSVTSMGFLLEMFNSESFDDSLESFTFGNSQNIQHFVALENRVNSDFFFEKVISEINFGGDISSVNLDFNDVIFLLSKVEEFHLGGGENSNNGTVFLDSVKLDVNGSAGFSIFGLVFRESLLFGGHPVFIESSESVFVEFLSPNGGEGSETSGGFDISDNSDNNHRGGFDNGDGFDNFFFVEFGTGFFNVSENVGHTSFESSESGKMDRGGGVISGERSTSTSVMSGSSSGSESKISVSRGFEFSV